MYSKNKIKFFYELPKYTHAKKKVATLSNVWGLFNLHSNSWVTYRHTLCGWRPSPTCPADLSHCWKQFSLPAKQYWHTCNMAKNCLKVGHVKPLDWPSGPELSLINLPLDNLGCGYMIISLPSRHISPIGKLAGWTDAMHSTRRGWDTIPAS